MRAVKTLAVLTMLASVACGEDTVTPTIEAPVVTISAPMISTPFLTAGSAAAPTVAWGGEVGTFALATPVTGVSISSTDGVVSWDESLPIGVNTVGVVATNSAGQGTASIEIDNEFQGMFSGGYNNDPSSQTTTNDFVLDYAADGTMTVLDSGTNEGAGTWSIDGSTVTAVYTYDGGGTFTTATDLTYSTVEAVLEGFWYSGSEVVVGSESGYVSVTLTPAS